MAVGDTRLGTLLDQWCGRAFLLAGGLFVVFAGLWGAFAFTSVSSESAQNVVGPVGWTIAFVGLLGIYSKVAAGGHVLPKAAVVFAGIGCLGGSVTAVGNLATVLDVIPALPAWFAALQLLLLVGIIPGFLTAAAVVLRLSRTTRRLGLFLILPAVIFAVNIVRVATLGSTTPIWSPFVLGAAQAVVLLGIGWTISTGQLQSEQSPRASGSSVE